MIFNVISQLSWFLGLIYMLCDIFSVCDMIVHCFLQIIYCSLYTVLLTCSVYYFTVLKNCSLQYLTNLLKSTALFSTVLHYFAVYTNVVHELTWENYCTGEKNMKNCNLNKKFILKIHKNTFYIFWNSTNYNFYQHRERKRRGKAYLRCTQPTSLIIN